MGLIATVLYAPILAPILGEMLGGYELTGWGDAERLSVDLLGLVTPTALHPWGGDWTETLRQTREGTARFRDLNTVFLGWMGLALAIVGAVRYRRRLGAWITGAIVFAVLSLGPLLQINGRSTFDFDGLMANFPLPFILLHYIPVVKANRVPNRFGVVLMLALAVLASFGIYWLLGKLRRRPGLAAVGGLLLAGLLLFEHWSVPLPLTDAQIPPALTAVAREEGDFAILQLPMGWRNSFGVQGAESTQAQYYQSYHQKRLISGNISRNPPFKFDYFQRLPIINSLISLQTYGEVDDERRAGDRSVASDLMGFYDIRYVAVAPGVPGRPPYVDTRDDSVAYVEDVLPVEKIYDEAGWLVYRVEQPPIPATLTVDLGSSDPLEAMALGEGWGEAEEIQGASARWATEQGARVFLPSAAGPAHRLTVTALPFTFPDARDQAMQVSVNGRLLPERMVLSPGWGTYTWNVPADLLRQGLNDLRLDFDRLSSPAEVLPGDGMVGSTGLRTPIAIEVNSGGPDGFAYITLGDSEDGSLHHSGYNLAFVHPETGKIVDRRGFDTTADGDVSESASLSAYISDVPDGQIIVVALQGEGATHLTDDAVSAFRSIGGLADPREIGGPHAIIGVKGAAPGSALESIGTGNGWLRVAPDERTLAVAVDTIQWEQISD
ncbi:interleukin-like EMT inducer domain-containing protein [Chloroflexota bacterium]